MSGPSEIAVIPERAGGPIANFERRIGYAGAASNRKAMTGMSPGMVQLRGSEGLDCEHDSPFFF